MESVASDPELASEMLALMNKELKKTRARIEQLEGSGSKASVSCFFPSMWPFRDNIWDRQKILPCW